MKRKVGMRMNMLSGLVIIYIYVVIKILNCIKVFRGLY